MPTCAHDSHIRFLTSSIFAGIEAYEDKEYFYGNPGDGEWNVHGKFYHHQCSDN